MFLITIDTLRADHMSLYGYPRPTTPALERLAARGLVFDRAIAQWPKTGSSFASVFTGRYPQSTGLTHKATITIPSDLPILPELFQKHGFETVAVVSNAVLGHKLGWDRGFDEYVETWGDDPSEDPLVYRQYLNAPRVNELARSLIEKHRDAERLFVWLHYSDPHAPYVLPAGTANPFLGDEVYRAAAAEEVPAAGRGQALADETDLRHYVAQYDANVLVADRHIGEIVDWIDGLGLLDDAAVVLFADHGESLGDHGSYFEHGPLPYNSTAHVPLLLFGPGVAAGERVAEPVELLDLLPTLLAWALPGVDTGEAEGRCLPVAPCAQAPGDERPGLAFSEAGTLGRDHFRSVQDARFKLIYRPRSGRPPEASDFSLYDLEADPRETIDLAASRVSEIRRLTRPLLSWMASARSDAAQNDALSEDELEALRALGYI